MLSGYECGQGSKSYLGKVVGFTPLVDPEGNVIAPGVGFTEVRFLLPTLGLDSYLPLVEGRLGSDVARSKPPCYRELV